MQGNPDPRALRVLSMVIKNDTESTSTWQLCQRSSFGQIEYSLYWYCATLMEDKVSLASSPKAGSSLSSMPLYENRLSIPFFIRLPTATAGAFITGMALGLSHGSKTAGLRFRAENSHRFPTTSTGWYLYHKSKNYHAMLGGIKEGMKMGLKISFWTGAFFLIEEAVDRLRGTKDFISTVVAGLSISGGFSAWSTYSIKEPNLQ